jgi:hypothetical protein
MSYGLRLLVNGQVSYIYEMRLLTLLALAAPLAGAGAQSKTRRAAPAPSPEHSGGGIVEKKFIVEASEVNQPLPTCRRA